MADKAGFGGQRRLDQHDLDIAHETAQVDLVVMQEPVPEIFRRRGRFSVLLLGRFVDGVLEHRGRLPKRVKLGLGAGAGKPQPQQVLGHMGARNLAPGEQHEGAFQHIAQFAHITRPAIGFQRLDG